MPKLQLHLPTAIADGLFVHARKVYSRQRQQRLARSRIPSSTTKRHQNSCKYHGCLTLKDLPSTSVKSERAKIGQKQRQTKNPHYNEWHQCLLPEHASVTHILVFVVDASNSVALNQIGAASGAAMLLLQGAYKSRSRYNLFWLSKISQVRVLLSSQNCSLSYY